MEQEYAELTAQIAELTARRDALKEALVRDMLNRQETSKDTLYGKFTVYTTTSYEYTDAVKKLEEKVKVAKVKERQKGLATMQETPSLRFTLPKHED